MLAEIPISDECLVSQDHSIFTGTGHGGGSLVMNTR
jgi:hypothetical protein